MLNTITIMGRLVKDPELRHTVGGTSVATFSLACERDITDKESNRQTDFIDCTAWGKQAEFISQYFGKGSMAIVSGRLELRDWTDKAGNKRRNAEIRVGNIYFGDSKRSEGSNKYAEEAAERTPPSQQSFEEIADGDEDYLPF